MSNRQNKQITRLRERVKKSRQKNSKKDEECVSEKRREREKWEKKKERIEREINLIKNESFRESHGQRDTERKINIFFV